MGAPRPVCVCVCKEAIVVLYLDDVVQVRCVIYLIDMRDKVATEQISIINVMV